MRKRSTTGAYNRDIVAPKTTSISVRSASTWYSWRLTGFYLYSVNLQGNVVPFLQAEFALSYRAVSLHSSAIAVGIILVGLLGDGSRRGSGGGAPVAGHRRLERRQHADLPCAGAPWINYRRPASRPAS